MGEVYRAKDSSLGREVAIKILPPSFEGDANRVDRFRREARLLASLSHPHIAAIHGLDQDQGRHFLVLELIEGQTIAERREPGALPIGEALEICRQIAEALEAAHEKGIIHRDLKPANIKLTPNNNVKVLDFGLAKALEPGGDDETTQLAKTIEGALLGTPAYMSPEQASGGEVNQQTDIWSFGCILYECLSGKQLFRGNNLTELLGAVLSKEPEWNALPKDIPPSVLALLRKCLERNPRRRLRNISDAVSDLNHALVEIRAGTRPRNRLSMFKAAVGLACVLILILAGFAAAYLRRFPARLSTPPDNPARKTAQAPIGEPKSVAVLPFASMNFDKADEYLVEGIAEEILNALSKIKALHVPGRSSCFSFKEATSENRIPRAARMLGVNHILEGSVQKSGDILRIRANLINAADGFTMWSESYDREITNIFAIQSDVATRVAEALKVQLGIAESRLLAKKQTDNPEAYRLYLLGRYHFGQSTEAGSSNAVRFFEEAIKLDPNYTLAYCGLADTYGWMGGASVAGRELWTKEKALAQKAVQLDPELGEAHFSLGNALGSFFDWTGAEREIKRAIELNPNLALAYDGYAWLLACLGRFEEAISMQKKAVALEPLSVLINDGLAIRLSLARRYDEAIAQCHKTLELQPGHAGAHDILGWNAIWKGEFEMALREFESAKVLAPDPRYDSGLGYAYAVMGKKDKAQATLDGLIALQKARYVSPFAIAQIYIGLGEKSAALAWLEKSYDDVDGACWSMKVDPVFDTLRTEPQFHALLKKLALE